MAQNPWANAKKSAFSRTGAPAPGADPTADTDPEENESAEGPSIEIPGYEEVPGGWRCGTCTYLAGTNCTNPVVNRTVDPDNGCCVMYEELEGQNTEEGPEPSTPGMPFPGAR